MNLKTPNMIYRYQSFNALSIDALCHDQLYFSAPTAFNDPLDCSPSIENDTDKERLQLTLSELIQARVGQEVIASLKAAKISSNQGQVHAKKQALEAAQSELNNIAYHATNPEYEVSTDEAETSMLTSHIHSELLKRNNRGICCLSTEYDNPLLWSHYGDQHRGFCVGYSLDRNPKPEINKVVYNGDRSIKTSLIAQAVLEDDKAAKRELDEQIFLRKAPLWAYEKEWRLFDQVGLQDSPLRLEEVNFGLRCPTAVMHAVMSALAPRELTFHHMYTHKSSFELKRTAEDLSEDCSHLPKEALSGIEIFGPITDK